MNPKKHMNIVILENAVSFLGPMINEMVFNGHNFHPERRSGFCKHLIFWRLNWKHSMAGETKTIC